MIARRLVIRGRVQGVGYRHALRREALRRGVVGWVRNRLDGTVEAHVQGAPEQLESLVAWARRGPTAAAVDEVTAEPSHPDDSLTGFEQRPTA